MHSSRMRTTHFSGCLCGGGVSAPFPIASWDLPPPLLWTEGMARACENITFPQLLLRPVKIIRGENDWKRLLCGSHVM